MALALLSPLSHPLCDWSCHRHTYPQRHSVPTASGPEPRPRSFIINPRALHGSARAFCEPSYIYSTRSQRAPPRGRTPTQCLRGSPLASTWCAERRICQRHRPYQSLPYQLSPRDRGGSVAVVSAAAINTWRDNTGVAGGQRTAVAREQAPIGRSGALSDRYGAMRPPRRARGIRSQRKVLIIASQQYL